MLLSQAQEAELTYAEVGATNGEDWPSAYAHDVDEAELGTGAGTFDRAVAALRRWQAHVGPGSR